MSRWPKISELVEQIASGKTSALDQVEKSFQLIEDNSEYQSIISVVKERAISRAKDIDSKIAKGEKLGRLAGVPFIAKDNMLTFGSKTTAASNMLKDFEAPYQSTAVEKLEAEGAICVAKANLDAFAHGASTENSDFMTTKNPHDASKVPGGSSGGSAAAVVLELAPFALGTDTGGSIRQPASFCGAVGLKPTYGLVSRSGVVAMASSTDVVGPLTTNVEDAALILDVISGVDELDSTTIPKDEKGYTKDLDAKDALKGKKIGVIKEFMSDGLDAGIKRSIDSAINHLKEQGAEVSEVSLPSIPLSLACYYILCPAEVSSNLSRYDGQKFGHSAKDPKDLNDSYVKSRSLGFGKEAKRRIMIGTYVLSSGYYDAYFKKAQQLRTLIIEEFNQAFENHDFLIGPVSPTTAFKIGENSDDPMKMYLQDVMTVGVSLAGVPAISLPVDEADGLPVGLQIIAPAKKDRELLKVSKQLEEIYK